VNNEDLGKAIEVVTETAIEVVGAASLGLVAASGAGAAAAAPVVLGLLVQKFAARRAEKQTRQFRSWISEVGRRLDAGDEEGAAEHILESIDEEWAHDAVASASRAIFLDIDEAAVPLLAALTALQAMNKRADRRDRRTVALLLDCDQSSIDALRHFISRCCSRIGSTYEGHIQVSFFTLADTVHEFGPDAANPNRQRIQLLPLGKAGEPLSSSKAVAAWPAHLHVETETAGTTVPDTSFERWPADGFDITALELLDRHGFVISGQTTSNEAVSQGQPFERLTTYETILYLHQIFVEPKAAKL
jgi:hypothetical protein